jgi:hypothetical protein
MPSFLPHLLYIALLTPYSIHTPTYTVSLPLSSFLSLPHIFTTFPLCSHECKAQRQPQECWVHTLLFSFLTLVHSVSQAEPMGADLLVCKLPLSLYRSDLSTHSSSLHFTSLHFTAFSDGPLPTSILLLSYIECWDSCLEHTATVLSLSWRLRYLLLDVFTQADELVLSTNYVARYIISP